MQPILNKIQAEIELISILPNDIKMLSNFFQLENTKLYLVGGCIRDIFLGKKPKDFDVCTNALPEKIINILTKYNIEYNVQGEHFGVIVAKMNDGDYEIATFRNDIQIDGNNRHPEVVLGVSIEDDVKRRDFTINALFMDLETRHIIDMVGGIDDLNNCIVRTVGNALERFNEDHLRKLRCLRFATRLGFNIHTDTFNAIVLNPELNISGERIFNELSTSFDTAKDKINLINLLYDTKLVYQIFSGLIINERHEIFDDSVISINTLLANIICPCNSDISKKLISKNFTLKIANSVEFLLNIKNIKNPLIFYNKRKSTNLTDTEISIYNNDTNAIMYLINFIPDPNLSSVLIDKGYKGKDLGDEINLTYINAFDYYIKNYT